MPMKAGMMDSRKACTMAEPSSAVHSSRSRMQLLRVLGDARDAEERVEDDDRRAQDHPELDDPQDGPQELVRRSAPWRTAAAACRSPGRRWRRPARRPRRPCRSRSCSCIPWGTASSSRPGTRPAARPGWRRRRTRTGSTARPMSRRIVPWANPRTKKPMKMSTRTRSIAANPLRNPWMSTVPPMSPGSPRAPVRGGARVAAPVERVASEPRPASRGPSGQVRSTPPTSAATPVVTAVTAASSSSSVRVRSAAKTRR